MKHTNFHTAYSYAREYYRHGKPIIKNAVELTAYAARAMQHIEQDPLTWAETKALYVVVRSQLTQPYIDACEHGCPPTQICQVCDREPNY
jgi:hypothetical protein